MLVQDYASIRGPLSDIADSTSTAGDYFLSATSADAAQDLQRADPKITIAILDVGIFRNHPDLKPSIGEQFDAVKDVTGDVVFEPGDFHATACAGLAAGVRAAANGVKGIAPKCSVMNIRIGRTRDGNFKITSEDIVQGIDFAWKNGADVLSNSWFFPESEDIRRAIERARTLGRRSGSKRRGCIVVAAAGNHGLNQVDFPARIQEVIAVTATDENGLIKTRPSNAPGWGSNTGPEVNIAAPGVRLRTCDIATPNNDLASCYRIFSGTSAATPLVAGAIALMLSANPRLTEQQVRDILLDTKNSDGTALNPHEYGAGRLNVRKLVEAARRTTNSIVGTLRRAGTLDGFSGSVFPPCYFLDVPSDSARIALRTYSRLPDVNQNLDALEQRNATTLNRLVGQMVTVHYAFRQDFGPMSILWGAEVQ